MYAAGHSKSTVSFSLIVGESAKLDAPYQKIKNFFTIFEQVLIIHHTSRIRQPISPTRGQKMDRQPKTPTKSTPMS